jgi:predicted Zn-dependent protease
MTQPISSTAADIERAQRLLGAGNLEDADKLINTILADSPDNVDGLYTFAVIQRLKKIMYKH